MSQAFTLYPDFATKALRCSGSLAVGELAAVEVSGAEGYMAGLRVRLRCDGRDVAMFPLADTDAWAVEGGSAKAFIELDTVELRKCFRHLDDHAVVQCAVIVESNGGGRILICKGAVNVKNWPAAPGQVPVTLATWKDDIAEVRGGLELLSNALDTHTASPSAHAALFAQKAGLADFNTHIADANAHGVTATGIGAVTEADFQTHLLDARAHEGLFNGKLNTAAFEAHTAGQQIPHGEADARLIGLEGAFARHDHGPDGGEAVNHADLYNAGVKTHNEIEEILDKHALSLGRLWKRLNGIPSTGILTAGLFADMPRLDRQENSLGDTMDLVNELIDRLNGG